MFGLMDFQLFGLFDELNALAGLPDPGMYLVPRGICRVRWDPLPPAEIDISPLAYVRTFGPTGTL